MNHSVITKFPHLLHGADYNPEQWLRYPDIVQKEDIELMQKAGVNCVSLGIFSWAVLEPKEGEYDFQWMDETIDRLYYAGIRVNLATPSGAKPLWLSEKYPEVRRVSQNLVRDLSGERHNHCYTSPIYREKVQRLDRMLAERYASHPGVVLWHISNEYGGECYCPMCQSAFRTWLKKKYGSLENLNHAWWTYFWSHQYTDWEQIHAPVPNGEMSVHGLVLDWKRFVTHQTVEFMKGEIAAVKSVAPDLPVTTNMMGFYDGLDYHKFADALDVVSWDNYPLWHNNDHMGVASFAACSHDLMRSIKRQPFLMMESSPSMMNWTDVSKQKRPGMHLLSSMQALAHGSDSVMYFQWRKSRGSFEKFHGAVVGHDGTADTRVFQEVSQVGTYLERLDPLLMNTEIHPEVAVLYDWENRWAIDAARGPRNCGTHYLETVVKHHRAFWEQGIQVDLPDMDADLSRYRLIIAPMLYLYRGGIAEKLKAFVENGGTLVGTYWSGVVDDTDLCYLGKTPGDGMSDVFGIVTEETDALYDGQKNFMVTSNDFMLQKSYEVTELCDVIRLNGAKALAVYGDDYYKGTPAFTLNHYGKGRAYYIAARLESSFYRTFYSFLTGKLGLHRALDTELPYGVTAHRRTGEQDVVFVENYNDSEAVVELPKKMQDIIHEETVSQLVLPPFGVRILTDD